MIRILCVSVLMVDCNMDSKEAKYSLNKLAVYRSIGEGWGGRLHEGYSADSLKPRHCLACGLAHHMVVALIPPPFE